MNGVVFIFIAGISACKTEVVENSTAERTEPAIFRRTELPCVTEKKRAVQKLGLNLTDGVEKLLELLLMGEDEPQLSVCTKL